MGIYGITVSMSHFYGFFSRMKGRREFCEDFGIEVGPPQPAFVPRGDHPSDAVHSVNLGRMNTM